MKLLHQFLLIGSIITTVIIGITIPVYIILQDNTIESEKQVHEIYVTDIITQTEFGMDQISLLMYQLERNFLPLPKFYQFENWTYFTDNYDDLLLGYQGTIGINNLVYESEIPEWEYNMSQIYNREISIFPNTTQVNFLTTWVTSTSLLNPENIIGINTLFGIPNSNKSITQSIQTDLNTVAPLFISISTGDSSITFIKNIKEDFDKFNTSKGVIVYLLSTTFVSQIVTRLNFPVSFTFYMHESSINETITYFRYSSGGEITFLDGADSRYNLYSGDGIMEMDNAYITSINMDRTISDFVVVIDIPVVLSGFQSYYAVIIVCIFLIFTLFIILLLFYNKYSKLSATELVLQNNTFISYIFHELRVPLNTIELYINILNQNKSIMGEEDQQFLGKANASMTQVNKILNDVLSLNKIKSGSFRLSLDYDFIPPLIYNTLSIFEKDQFNLHIDDFFSNHLLYIDELRINQVITNFITNAKKFSRGKPINIYLIKNLVYCIDNEWYADISFKVQDQGIGINDNDKKKIFQPYTYIDNKSKEKSIGLGLSICKYIIELHKGEIGFESEINVGSTFYFNITSKIKLTSEIGETTYDELRINDRNILIVDDSENNCLFLSKILKGNTCTLLHNGQDCIDYLTKNNNIDLLFLDNNMPGITGCETAQEIRKFNKELEIVIISGDQSLVDKKLDYVNNIVIKPVNIKKLNNCVKNKNQ